MHICWEHASDKLDSVSNGLGSQLSAARADLRNRLTESAVIEFATVDPRFTSVVVSSSLLDHGEVYMRISAADWIRRLDPREGQRLTPAQIEQAGCIESLVSRVIDDISTGEFHAHVRGASYLTDSRLDIDVLRNIEMKSRIRNEVEQGLPTIVHAPLSSVLELRAAEAESFERYRDALSGAMRGIAADSESAPLSELVRSELNDVTHSVRRNREKLRRAAGRDVAIVTGFLSVGLFSGVIPAAEIFASLGAFGFGLDGLRNFAAMGDAEDEARDSRWYFLWRLESRT